MVLLGRIELPTSPLPRVRSTTELQQRRSRAPVTQGRGALLSAGASVVKRRLRFIGAGGMAQCMSDEPATSGTGPKSAEKLSRSDPGRDERLAVKLRENLRRRKAQARAVSAPAQSAPEDESGRLPKSPPES